MSDLNCSSKSQISYANRFTPHAQYNLLIINQLRKVDSNHCRTAYETVLGPSPVYCAVLNVESQRVELQPMDFQSIVQQPPIRRFQNCDVVDTASYIWSPFHISATRGSRSCSLNYTSNTFNCTFRRWFICKRMWAGRDLNPQKLSPPDLQSGPLPITGYLPKYGGLFLSQF